MKQPPSLILPDPTNIFNNDVAIAVTAANGVRSCLDDGDTSSASGSTTPQKKRESYGNYSSETRLKIGQILFRQWPSKNSQTFFQIFSDVRWTRAHCGIWKSYLNSLLKDTFKMQMPRSPRGRPTLLPSDIDLFVQQYVRNLRSAGGVVNTSIIIANEWSIIVKIMYFVLLFKLILFCRNSNYFYN